MNFHEIFGKDMTYDNLKSHKNKVSASLNASTSPGCRDKNKTDKS